MVGGWGEVLRRCAEVFAAAWKRRLDFKQITRTRSEAEFLPAELEILDSPPWPLARVILWMLMLILVIALVWSYLSRIDIVASARGSIIPDSRTKIVQSAVEGKVASIEVADGESVEAGDVLIRLDTVSARAAHDRSSTELQSALLGAAMARLLAQIDFQDQATSAPPQLAQLEELAEVPAAQIATQQNVLDGLFERQKAQAEQFAAQRMTQQAALQLQDDQAEATRKLVDQDKQIIDLQLAGADEQLAKVEAERPMVQRDVDASRTLRERGIISLGALHAAEAKLLRLEARYEELLNSRDKNQAEGTRLLEQRRRELNQHLNQAAEIKARVAQLQTSENLALAEFRSLMADQAAQQSRQAQALQQELIQIEHLLDNHEITAPEAGVVEQLVVYTTGAVLQPSQQLMMIVPRQAVLIAEVEILNKDVGFVADGDDVRVKVDAFTYTKYGLVEGKVIDVADDAIDREGLGPVFKARIELLQNEILVDGQPEPLRPGMSITAEVKTGERRVIDFFLDPFLRTRDESLNVR